MDILKELMQIFALTAEDAAKNNGRASRDHVEEIHQLDDFPNGGLRFAVTIWRDECDPPRVTKEMSLIEVMTLLGNIVATISVIPAVQLLKNKDLKR